MTSDIIIDAYNLIHRASDLRKLLETGLENSREQLLYKLSVYRQNKKIKITLVFDGDRVGKSSTLKQAGINIIYSVPPRSADDVIKILLRKSKKPQNITVISSDNEVSGFARTCGAKVLRSEEFYKKYLIFEEKSINGEQREQMNEDELQLWMEIFKKSADS